MGEEYGRGALSLLGRCLTIVVTVALVACMAPSFAFASEPESRLAAGAISGEVAQGVSVQYPLSPMVAPRKALAARTSDPIRYFKFLDKAKTQAVAVTGYYDEYGRIVDASVWYVRGNSTHWLYSPDDYWGFFKSEIRIFKVKGGKIFKVESAPMMFRTKSVAWFISNGTCSRLPDIGMDMKRYKGNQFSIVRDTYDAILDRGGMWNGHSYKPYYYHWTGKKFIEYGGKAISKKKLKKLKKGTKILKAIKRSVRAQEGQTPRFGRIYYRANGIINVNYTTSSEWSTSYYNVTLKCNKKGKLSYVDVSGYGSSALAKATQYGFYKVRGGSSSEAVGVSYPKKLPARMLRK